MMLRCPRWMGLVVLAVLLASCAKSEPAGGGGSGRPGSGGAAALNLMPMKPVTEEEAKEFAEQFLKAVESPTANSFETLFDWDRLISRGTDGLGMSAKEISEFRMGFVSASRSHGGFVGSVRSEVQRGGKYKFLRVHQNGGETRVLMRLLTPLPGSADGVLVVNFHDFLVVKSGGMVRAADVKILAIGEDLSVTIGRTVGMLKAKEDHGVLQRLFGTKNDASEDLSKMQQLFANVKGGRGEEALKVYQSISEEMQGQLFCLVAAIQSCVMANDLETLEGLISDLKRLYPENPCVDFLSIDYYVMRQDLPSAVQACERLNHRLGGDGHLWSLIAGLQLQLGKPKEAKQAVEEGIKIEADSQELQEMRLEIAVHEDDHAGTFSALKQLVTDFDFPIDLDAIRQSPEYAKFVESPEFEKLVEFVEK